MNLLFQALLKRMHDLANEIGIRKFSVAHKKNASGQMVAAIIISDDDGPLAVDKLPGAVPERKPRH